MNIDDKKTYVKKNKTIGGWGMLTLFQLGFVRTLNGGGGGDKKYA